MRKLRAGICALTLQDLPPESSGPRGELSEKLERLREAGIEAVQSHQPEVLEAIQRAGLIATALARVDKPGHARAVARAGRDRGCDCTTLHVGNGFESDDEARALMEAIVEASVAEGYPMFVETHRATVTQDMKRTLDLAVLVPELRFNSDFSHWYTGQEMTYGGVDHKIERLAPVIERTRFIHGRISSPGCIQIPVTAPGHSRHVQVFKTVWTRSFEGFLRDPASEETIGFYPELGPPSYHYARLVATASGELREETDRWEEALLLITIARECWRSACAAVGPENAGDSR
jgi:hypothetical protein